MRITLDFAAVLSQWPLLLKGVGWTLLLTAFSAVLGVAIGVAGAWARSSGALGLRTVVAATWSWCATPPSSCSCSSSSSACRPWA
jgi:polar amino acid transport system permease protein